MITSGRCPIPWSSGTMKLIGNTSAPRKVRVASSSWLTTRSTRPMAGSRNDWVFGRFVSATSYGPSLKKRM
jgi:hypothetical protein